ncbi:MAG: hypothetical protein ACI4UB_06000 [Limosilactobacillus sp.]
MDFCIIGDKFEKIDFKKLGRKNADFVYKTLILYPFVLVMHLLLRSEFLTNDVSVLRTAVVYILVASIMSFAIGISFSVYINDFRNKLCYFLAFAIILIGILPTNQSVGIVILYIIMVGDFLVSGTWIFFLSSIDRKFFKKNGNNNFPATLIGVIGTIIGAIIGLLN